MSGDLFSFEAGYRWNNTDSAAFELFYKWRKQGRLGFLDLPFNLTLHSDTVGQAEAFRRNYDTLFVAGIGGSSLGLKAILSALGEPGNARVVVVDSPDTKVINRAVNRCESERSVISVVTKSGGTAETMSVFMQLRDKLGESAPVIAVTDPVNGELRKLAEAKGWSTLPVPANVGGRFSVLSPVGLFPAAFAGIETRELLRGAADVVEDFDKNGESSLAGRIAGAFLSNFTSHPIHVFMPYSDFLYDSALWFSQLWAESLGKANDLLGNTVETGQTPLACRGPADQHSLVQLFMEGPRDKTISIVTEGSGISSKPRPGEFRGVPTMGYLEGRNPDELRMAEAEATASVLRERGLPVDRVHLPEVTEVYLGQFIMAFEIATVLSGLAMGINPLNQPGVEKGKILTYRAMGREGY